MKKTILVLAMVMMILPAVFSENDGNLYVSLEPKFQLPSLNLNEGTKSSSFGMNLGFELGLQYETVWSVGFRTAFQYYFQNEDFSQNFSIPLGLRVSKEIPVTTTFSLMPFLGTGAQIDVTNKVLRPFVDTGVQLQFYYDEKWNFFVGYEANFNVNTECILQQGISMGFRYYPLRQKQVIDVGITEDGNRIKIDVPAIVFDPNSSEYKDQSIEIKRQNKKVLDTVANLLKGKKYSSYNVTIEAYANAVLGTDEEKPVLLRLSQGRADAVKNELIKRGIEGIRLNAVGKGARNSSDAAENRRAEFILEK